MFLNNILVSANRHIGMAMKYYSMANHYGFGIINNASLTLIITGG